MRLLVRGATLLAALAMLFLGVGWWNATRPPVIVRATLPLEGLPPGTRLKVLLLSDTHFGHPDMGTGRLLAIAARANAERPDLILLAGDYMGGKTLDWPRVRLEQALPPLAALDAPLGVFAVMGNHDESRWTPIVMARQLRPRLLVNSHAEAGPVTVVGLDSASHGANLPRAMKGVAPGRPLLLLIHEGDHLVYLNKPPGHPVLALAGHTHGGQVVLPLIGSLGDLLLGRPKCTRGFCQLGRWPLFVTSGIGTSWLPIRYGVPPELVVLTLVPPPARQGAAVLERHSAGRKSGTER
jgi:predicted MPP superfamily phosphohydrolase